MIQKIDINTARIFFNILPKEMQITTLSPDYAALDSLRNKKLQNIFLLIKHQNNFALIFFHLIKTIDHEISDLMSPYNYGETLYSYNGVDFINYVNDELTKWCRANNVLLKFNRHHPLILNSSHKMNNKIYNRKVILINLNENFYNNLQPRVRSTIQKILQNNYKISIKNTFNADEVMKVYYDNMKLLKANDFYFFNKEYFNSLSSFQNSKIFSYYENNELLAFIIILFSKSAKVAEYHLGSASLEGKKKNMMKLLIFEAAIFFKENNYNIFYLGGGRTVSDNDSLLQFKKLFSKDSLDFFVSSEIYDLPKYNFLKKKFNNNDNIIFYRNDI
jgi:hypothetical protein